MVIKAFQRYYRFIILNLIVIFIIRLIEVILISTQHRLISAIVVYEVIGLVYDIIVTNLFLLPAFGVYYIIWRRNPKRADNAFVLLFIFLGLFHLIILNYFKYQLVPLDIFLFQYSLKEILFTITTSDTGYSLLIGSIFFLLVGIYLAYKWISKRQFSQKLIFRSLIVYALMLIVTIILFSFRLLPGDKFSKNKSIYFYFRTFRHVIHSFGDISYYSTEDSEKYQSLFEIKDPVDPAYPLLHTFEPTDPLGSYFKLEDTIPPNLVILIVEGLNDDFLYTYKGLDLMPFLAGIKDQGLYWEKCFALGERSFAAVPSIIGGLPHGIKGFTLLNQLPYHQTLVSVLKSTGYYTSFFYGQGSWFHSKDRFFKYNNIDLIFDKDRFSSEYKKVIAGNDKFFWGYNDQDLFNQSLEVMDTLPQKPRLDIYFTGSTHSPFAIADKAHYTRLTNDLARKIASADDRNFFSYYQDYIMSIIFLDDALKDFFEKYKTRNEYSNTVFIITGDHPMTELPRTNALKKYHVPLIIYSPMLVQSGAFSEVVCQLDIYETILGFLSSNYPVKVPPVSASLGDQLSVSDRQDRKFIAFMNDNREIVDIYSDGYFFSEGKVLYQVENDLTLRRIFDRGILKQFVEKSELFQKVNYYVCMYNKIIPDSLYFNYLGYQHIYSLSDMSGSFFDTEFHPITGKIPIQNKTVYFDFSLIYKGVKDEGVSIVYQLSDAKDSLIFWKNYGLAPKESFLQFRALIPEQDVHTDTVYFNTYFWNKKKYKIGYRNLTTGLFKKQ
ncbi:MAG: sulfatase-like hydrolase/transferase [Bacteroidales bacterium]|nr:sulfatase-like hydrolase/transferase [Bacteroidales bacterium]